MRALIVDDEVLARERLAALLGGIDGVRVVGEAGDGRAALEMATELEPDVVFLDVRMPVMDGFEAARHFGAFDRAPAIVFCTAYEEHALAAFEADAVDYLVKPIRAERLQAALAKAQRLRGDGATVARGSTAPRRQRGHLCARVRGNLVLIPVPDIDYLHAQDRYVLVRHARGEVLVEEALKSLEDEFSDRFVRIHRNCLVALQRISGLVKMSEGRVGVRVDGVDEPLEVSRRNLPALRQQLRAL